MWPNISSTHLRSLHTHCALCLGCIHSLLLVESSCFRTTETIMVWGCSAHFSTNILWIANPTSLVMEWAHGQNLADGFSYLTNIYWELSVCCSRSYCSRHNWYSTEQKTDPCTHSSRGNTFIYQAIIIIPPRAGVWTFRKQSSFFLPGSPSQEVIHAALFPGHTEKVCLPFEDWLRGKKTWGIGVKREHLLVLLDSYI